MSQIFFDSHMLQKVNAGQHFFNLIKSTLLYHGPEYPHCSLQYLKSVYKWIEYATASEEQIAIDFLCKHKASPDTLLHSWLSQLKQIKMKTIYDHGKAIKSAICSSEYYTLQLLFGANSGPTTSLPQLLYYEIKSFGFWLNNCSRNELKQ